METAEQSMTRLVGALELLFEQECLQASAGDHVGVLATQRRSTPLVQRLAELGAAALSGPTRIRIAALEEKRRRSQKAMADQIARIREELTRTQMIRNRLRKIAPAYGQKGRVVPRLAVMS